MNQGTGQSHCHPRGLFYNELTKANVVLYPFVIHITVAFGPV